MRPLSLLVAAVSAATNPRFKRRLSLRKRLDSAAKAFFWLGAVLLCSKHIATYIASRQE